MASSRWGSFLQQAVAGVESRLDNILAEGNEETVQKPANKAPAVIKSDSGSRSASPSSNKANDRLQERLARAIAAKNTAQKADSLSLSLTPSRTASPASVNESPRGSIDIGPARNEEKAELETSLKSEIIINTPSDDVAVAAKEPEEHDAAGTTQPVEPQKELDGLSARGENVVPRLSSESARSSIPRESIDSTRQSTDLRSSAELAPTEISDIGMSLKTPAEYDALLKLLQSNFETSEIQRQEEVHGYVERLDALQAKLQYLAKESAEAARKASSAAASGSLEKKLADKEEQVALLMEEGQKLSKKELTHLSTIKKLRAKIQEDSKEVAEANAKQEKAEKEAASALDRLKRAEVSDKRLNEKQKLVNQLRKDVETLNAERSSRDATIVDLKKQLDEAIAQERQAEAKQANEALQVEKKRARELEDDLANLKIEKNLVSDRAQAQIKELKEKMEKDLERARITELEMKTEQHMLESKLEVMRARVEEASSGATGDAQAKLLRQIETLQSQYAVASENWQGIEASLIARAANLEKERDEATRRETDMRRKAREVTLKAKRHEDELDETKAKMPSFEEELARYKVQVENLHQCTQQADSALAEAKVSFEQEKESWKLEMQQRIDEERQKWQEDAAAQSSISYGRVDSPVASSRKGLTSEYLGLQNLQMRKTSARSINSDSPTLDRLFIRRTSTQPQGMPSGHNTPTRQDSLLSLNISRNGEVSDAPSVHTENDDFFESVPSPSSQHQTINDMVSVSTAGAGPTVQLVERMSSAVRRLESEKAGTKEDILRLSSQRDEARAEIVSLMKEVNAKRAAESKLATLEAEVAEVKARYETTLEMLGEKSELVEELRSDIDDIKTMYRELVERTVK